MIFMLVPKNWMLDKRTNFYARKGGYETLYERLCRFVQQLLRANPRTMPHINNITRLQFEIRFRRRQNILRVDHKSFRLRQRTPHYQNSSSISAVGKSTAI